MSLLIILDSSKTLSDQLSHFIDVVSPSFWSARRALSRFLPSSLLPVSAESFFSINKLDGTTIASSDSLNEIFFKNIISEKNSLFIEPNLDIQYFLAQKICNSNINTKTVLDSLLDLMEFGKKFTLKNTFAITNANYIKSVETILSSRNFLMENISFNSTTDNSSLFLLTSIGKLLRINRSKLIEPVVVTVTAFGIPDGFLEILSQYSFEGLQQETHSLAFFPIEEKNERDCNYEDSISYDNSFKTPFVKKKFKIYSKTKSETYSYPVAIILNLSSVDKIIEYIDLQSGLVHQDIPHISKCLEYANVPQKFVRMNTFSNVNPSMKKEKYITTYKSTIYNSTIYDYASFLLSENSSFFSKQDKNKDEDNFIKINRFMISQINHILSSPLEIIPIHERAYARVGLMGNPSDNFQGKTLSVTIKDFWVDVSLVPSSMLTIIPHPLFDKLFFGSLYDLFSNCQRDGFNGGVRLVLATCKKFFEFCKRNNKSSMPKDRNFYLSEGFIDDNNEPKSSDKLDNYSKACNINDSIMKSMRQPFALCYNTNIPVQVGLAGSSSIIVAVIKAIMRFYNLTYENISMNSVASLALSVETEELGICAGLQDRIVQVYDDLVIMDFTEKTSKTKQKNICSVNELDSISNNNYFSEFNNGITDCDGSSSDSGCSYNFSCKIADIVKNNHMSRIEKSVNTSFSSLNEYEKNESTNDEALKYRVLKNSSLPSLMLAIARDPSDSGRIHANVKARWESKDPSVIAATNEWISLVERTEKALSTKDYESFCQFADMNFDLRRKIYGDLCLGRKNIEMIEIARKYNAAAKFPGSAGAVLIIPRISTNLWNLNREMEQKGYVLFKISPNVSL